jgi:hypothetical protein
MKQAWKTLSQRWKNSMPKFFKVVFLICALVSGCALAVNTAIIAGGGTTHDWWRDVYPYLLGIPAGMAFCAKFTQRYSRDGEPIDYDDYNSKARRGKTVLDKNRHDDDPHFLKGGNI